MWKTVHYLCGRAWTEWNHLRRDSSVLLWSSAVHRLLNPHKMCLWYSLWFWEDTQLIGFTLTSSWDLLCDPMMVAGWKRNSVKIFCLIKSIYLRLSLLFNQIAITYARVLTVWLVAKTIHPFVLSNSSNLSSSRATFSDYSEDMWQFDNGNITFNQVSFIIASSKSEH